MGFELLDEILKQNGYVPPTIEEVEEDAVLAKYAKGKKGEIEEDAEVTGKVAEEVDPSITTGDIEGKEDEAASKAATAKRQGSTEEEENPSTEDQQTGEVDELPDLDKGGEEGAEEKENPSTEDQQTGEVDELPDLGEGTEGEDDEIYADVDELVEASMRTSLKQMILEGGDTPEEKLEQIEIVENVELTKDQMLEFMNTVIHPILYLSELEDKEAEEDATSVSTIVYEAASIYDEFATEDADEDKLNQSLEELGQEFELDDDTYNGLLEETEELLESTDYENIFPDVYEVSEAVIDYINNFENDLPEIIEEARKPKLKGAAKIPGPTLKRKVTKKAASIAAGSTVALKKVRARGEKLATSAKEKGRKYKEKLAQSKKVKAGKEKVTKLSAAARRKGGAAVKGFKGLGKRTKIAAAAAGAAAVGTGALLAYRKAMARGKKKSDAAKAAMRTVKSQMRGASPKKKAKLQKQYKKWQAKARKG